MKNGRKQFISMWDKSVTIHGLKGWRNVAWGYNDQHKGINCSWHDWDGMLINDISWLKLWRLTLGVLDFRTQILTACNEKDLKYGGIIYDVPIYDWIMTYLYGHNGACDDGIIWCMRDINTWLISRHESSRRTLCPHVVGCNALQYL